MTYLLNFCPFDIAKDAAAQTFPFRSKDDILCSEPDISLIVGVLGVFYKDYDIGGGSLRFLWGPLRLYIRSPVECFKDLSAECFVDDHTVFKGLEVCSGGGEPSSIETFFYYLKIDWFLLKPSDTSSGDDC